MIRFESREIDGTSRLGLLVEDTVVARKGLVYATDDRLALILLQPFLFSVGEKPCLRIPNRRLVARSRSTTMVNERFIMTSVLLVGTTDADIPAHGALRRSLRNYSAGRAFPLSRNPTIPSPGLENNAPMSAHDASFCHVEAQVGVHRHPSNEIL